MAPPSGLAAAGAAVEAFLQRRHSAEAALMLAAGAAQDVAFVHTRWWPLALLCMALLAWRVARAAPRRAAACGFAFGFAWLAAGVWWLFISMHRYGGLPAWMAVLAVAALCAALALLPALAMALCAAGSPGAGQRRGARFALRFVALWLAAELVRGQLFTGFPWLASGYAQIDSPLAVLAPWLGVYGIGAAAAGLAALLVWPWLGPSSASAAGRPVRRWWPPLAAMAALGLLALATPGDFSSPGRALHASLLQTNVPQNEKFSAEHMASTLRQLAGALHAAPGDLVLAPETAQPLLPSQLQDLAPGYWSALNQGFDGRRRAALIGMPLGDFARGYTNSVVALGAGSDPAYRYDKLHLVPFGEFIPAGFRWFTELMNIPLGDFNRGVRNPPSYAFAGEHIAPNICYEDLFGEELALRFVDPDRAPSVLANVSNIAWFGDTVAIEQHLNISRMRALELQRPMLRATNTGATAIIDHRGRVMARLASGTRATLSGTVQARHGVTPYAWWAARAGLWPLAALALLLWLISFLPAARSAATQVPERS